MFVEGELQEYMDGIGQKDRICSEERLEGEPPCEPLGEVCGVERYLEKLVESLREVHSPLVEPYLRPNREKVSGLCPFLHDACCPGPMDNLADWVAETIEAVDERHARRERGRAFLSSLPAMGIPGLAEVDRAYEEAAGTWTDCDWPTAFGRARLNLQGWTAAEAESQAVESVWGSESDAWLEAAEWLRLVERQAAQAEEQAGKAVAAAHRGEWREAMAHAHRAWSVELNSGRHLRREGPAWQKLFRAVAVACPAVAAAK